MPALADLLCQGVNNSSGFDSAWYVRFAYNLHMDVKKARNLFSMHGKGQIYAPTGFVMKDTPYHRYKMTASFGACVVVTSGGDTFVRRPEQIGAVNRRKASLCSRRERETERHEKERFFEKKRLERLFEDGQTKPSPKRGGKANSHADIGRYVNTRNMPLSACETKSVLRFRVINIAVQNL